MNIFVLDTRPSFAARYHTDIHLGKMLIEAVQILSTVAHLKGLDAPYKPTHKHHRCVVWAAESAANSAWLWDLAYEIYAERWHRFGTPHKSGELLGKIPSKLCTSPEYPYDFALAMPDEFLPEPGVTRASPQEAVAAYRKYYMRDKISVDSYRRLGYLPSIFEGAER